MVEFALGLPVFILLMASLADAVTLGYNRVTMVYAAHEGVRSGIEASRDWQTESRAIEASKRAASVFGLQLDEDPTVSRTGRGELGSYLRVSISRQVPLMVLPTSDLTVDVEGRLDFVS